VLELVGNPLEIWWNMSNSFCVYPWMHVQLKPDGQMKPCCRFDHTLDDSIQRGINENRVQHSSFSQALKSEFWQSIRRDMIEGKPIPGCWKCHKLSGDKDLSMRFNANRSWNSGLQTGPSEANVDIGVRYLELTTGRLCNLKCRTCSSSLSTTWEKDDKLLEPIFEDRKSYGKLPKTLDFSVDDESLRELRYIKLTGGEPMLSPNFIRFIDKLIQKGYAKNINLEIYTNASWVPKSEILNRLDRFNLVNIFLSIDGIGRVNDYIRSPSKWPDVEQATRKWIEHSLFHGHFEIVFSPTISLYNAHHIYDLFDWWQTLQVEYFGRKYFFQPSDLQLQSILEGRLVYSLGKMSPTRVFTPEYMSPALYPDKARIFDQLKRLKDDIQTWSELVDFRVGANLKTIGEYQQALYNIINHIEDHCVAAPAKSPGALLADFYNFNDALDSIRDEALRDSLPELEKYRGVTMKENETSLSHPFDRTE
jgi:hypothetical protein